MFNNLIESSSHAGEFKRRGSFFLFTTATYALLFAIAGVASIYAYDAHLDQETGEVVTMLAPVDIHTPRRDRENQPTRSQRRISTQQTVDQRRAFVARTDQPIAPSDVSTKPSNLLPVREGIPRTISDIDMNGTGPVGPIGPNAPGGGGNGENSVSVARDFETPPPVPVQRAIPPISKGVITSQALYLPRPPYPILAKQTHVSGTVSIQVLLDETGKVISAHAISGHPMLVPEAVKAAYQARFSPTLLDNRPVKVSGVITYNFVLQ